MDGSPQKYHFSFWSNKQDGRHRRLFWLADFPPKFFLKLWIDFHKTLQEWLLDGLQLNINFYSDWSTRWPPNGLFWLAEFQTSSSLKLLGQIYLNFVGMMYGWSFSKRLLFVSVEKKRWPPGPILDFNWLIFKNLLLWNYLAKFSQTL